jgi:hypothetical protein
MNMNVIIEAAVARSEYELTFLAVRKACMDM